MKYLHKLYFFKSKLILNISTSVIDYMTFHKVDNELKGIRLILNIKPDFSHIVEGEPAYTNHAAFNDLFVKTVASYAGSDGNLKKYSAWINPDNIGYIHSEIPGFCIVLFTGGNCLSIAREEKELLTELLEHGKQYKEGMKSRYGKK